MSKIDAITAWLTVLTIFSALNTFLLASVLWLRAQEKVELPGWFNKWRGRYDGS